MDINEVLNGRANPAVTMTRGGMLNTNAWRDAVAVTLPIMDMPIEQDAKLKQFNDTIDMVEQFAVRELYSHLLDTSKLIATKGKNKGKYATQAITVDGEKLQVLDQRWHSSVSTLRQCVQLSIKPMDTKGETAKLTAEVKAERGITESRGRKAKVITPQDVDKYIRRAYDSMNPDDRVDLLTVIREFMEEI